MKKEIILLEIINDEVYGKLAHFYSDLKGNYYSRIIETNNNVIYDELSEKEQKELVLRISKTEKRLI